MLETQPDKITLSDWQAANGNIFDYLINTVQATYLEGADADMMDFLLASMYGQRKVRIFFESLTAQEAAKYIDKVYHQRWQKEFDLFNEFLALEGDAVTTGSNSTNQLNKTSGFNSEELVDSNGSDITGANTNSSKTQQGLLAKARAVRERKFHEQICEDIARFITLSIY